MLRSKAAVLKYFGIRLRLRGRQFFQGEWVGDMCGSGSGSDASNEDIDKASLTWCSSPARQPTPNRPRTSISPSHRVKEPCNKGLIRPEEALPPASWEVTSKPLNVLPVSSAFGYLGLCQTVCPDCVVKWWLPGPSRISFWPAGRRQIQKSATGAVSCV